MDTNACLKKVPEESFSKKGVKFCHESSILYYATEGTVDSLNDNVIHKVNNDNFPLSPEFSNMLQNSIDSHAENASDQYLGKLPEVKVVLEKLPEALVYKYICSNNANECSLMPNVPQNIDKVCSLKSDSSHHEKITDLAISPTNLALKKNKCPLQNSKLSNPQLPSKENVSETCSTVGTFSKNVSKASKKRKIVSNVKSKSKNVSKHLSAQHLDQNLDFKKQSSLLNNFVKLPPSKKIETFEFLDKHSSEKNEILKFIDSDASESTDSQVNCDEISFDKYPCVHLKKLNIDHYFYGISSSSDGLQGKKDVPVDLEQEVGNDLNVSGLSLTEKTLFPIKEVDPKIGLSLTPPIKEVDPKIGLSLTSTIKEVDPKIGLSLTPSIKEVDPKIGLSLTSTIKKVDPKIDLSLTPPIKEIDPKIGLSLAQKTLSWIEKVGPKIGLAVTEKTLHKEVGSKTINLSSPIIDVEGDSTSSDLIFPQEINPTRRILEDLSTDSLDEAPSNDNSVLFDKENTPNTVSPLQNKSNLFKYAQNKFPIVLLKKLDLSCSDTIYSKSSTEKTRVTSVTDVLDLPIQIENVCSISRESFEKRSPKKRFNTIKKHQKKSSNQSFTDQLNESGLSIIKSKSNDASSFINFSESSSDIIISDSSISSSDDSINEDDLPLIMASKKKSSLPHSFHHSENSSSDDNDVSPLINLKTNATLAKKTKNSFHNSENSTSEDDDVIPLINLKTNATLAKKSKNSNIKSHAKHKKKKSKHDNSPLVGPVKASTSLTPATKAKNSLSKSHKSKKKSSINTSSECSSVMIQRISKSQMPCGSNKEKKNTNKPVELLSSKKKKSNKKSLRKKQMKIYKMITKYLKMQIESKKHKKKSKKRKNLEENSKSTEKVKLVISDNESDTESTLSSDSVALIYDSIEQEHSYSQNENSFQKTCVQCKKVCYGESSSKVQEHSYARNKNWFNKRYKTSANKAYHGELSSVPKKSANAKKSQKSIDKFRLGFLSNKLPLRFYNRFSASERLLLSKCKLKKNKKKEVKRLFNKLKGAGLMTIK